MLRFAPPLVILLGSLFLFGDSFSIRVPNGEIEGVGPAVFPQLALAGMIVIAAIELGRLTFGTASGGSGQILAGEEQAPSAKVGFYWGDLLATLLIGALYVWLMRVIGFIPATALFQMAMLAGPFRQRRLRIVIGAPVALTIFYYIIFVRLMAMPLPQGQGPFRTLSQLLF